VVTYNVVVNVNNPDEVLMPGMTAYVSVVVAEKKDVLLVPSAALRFKPEDVANEPRQPRRGGPREGRGEGARATIYVLENGAPKAVQIRPGITDGRNIEVVSSDLQPGADIIVGNTETAKPSGTQPGAFRMRLF
jgi:HlyD family secretion protein